MTDDIPEDWHQPLIGTNRRTIKVKRKRMNLISEVLRLDAEATKGDWYEHANGSSVWTTHMLDQETKPSLCVANVHGRSDEEMVDNCLLIALYRTAAPKLARALKVAILRLVDLDLVFCLDGEFGTPIKDTLLEIEKELSTNV